MEENEQMNQEQQQSESSQEMSTDGVDYVQALSELKRKTVSREDYEKVQKENAKLLNALINGEQVTVEAPEQKEDIKKLREDLFGKQAVENDMTNLEFVQKALRLRTAIIESGEEDPFLPKGRGIELTRDDYEKAELAATVYQECIDIAKGDSAVFTAELMRRTSEGPRIPNQNAKKQPYRR